VAVEMAVEFQSGSRKKVAVEKKVAVGKSRIDQVNRSVDPWYGSNFLRTDGS